MAKRRDSTTRIAKQWQNITGEQKGIARKSPVARMRGRRGVRARARLNRRIEARQPSGGVITNS